MASPFDPRRVYRLENSVQEYAWGSPSAIPELLGRENPANTPQAELWMGAHPKAPSRVLTDPPVPLTELIDRDPAPILGRSALDRFGPRLPFLFKVLSAARALSIQAHPNREQAREGYRREDEAAIPLDAPERNYRDENHKPELLCALGDFWGLRGFLPPQEARENLLGLGVPALASLAESLESGAAGLRTLLAELLEMTPEEAERVVAAAAAACSGREGERYRWVERLAVQYPADVGVLSPLFLNLVHLAPGEAMYQEAGELHAYLEGTGIELMANSDNVLRGGLTAKHVDVPELLRVLTFEVSSPELLLPRSRGAGVAVFETPTSEFRLSRITLAGGGSDSGVDRSIELLLCVGGGGSVSWSGAAAGELELRRGDSFLVPASVPAYRLTGELDLFRADLPSGQEANGGRGDDDLG